MMFALAGPGAEEELNCPGVLTSSESSGQAWSVSWCGGAGRDLGTSLLRLCHLGYGETLEEMLGKQGPRR